MAALGTHVLITDRNGGALILAADGVRSVARASDVDTCTVDVSNAEDVEAAAQPAIQRFGALHIAVNNPGVVNRGLAWELSVEECTQCST